ncbi:von Willebrand factor, type A [Teredinibacter turnerae T7901]|uniref:von Willebrand factor, type A n=2 Tax=Teredinibacter turnerae TaxID=2426 RepID=C5BMI3_TERTT|nr:von Willebrand factor, type A [Teredinibacter turnerae T7901]
MWRLDRCYFSAEQQHTMPNILARFRGFLSLLCVFSLLAGGAQAQAPAPADVRLVIDVSGSMKRNDPNNLRQPAVDLLVQLLPEGSRAGVWTFGKWVNMLVPHRDVTDPWRATAQAKASEINSVGLFTNIGEALEKATFEGADGGAEFRKSIILLTDGMVDIDKSPEQNKREWRRIADEVIPRLKEAGVTVHTIALSANADTNLLNKISLATGGMAEVAHSADDLMRIFLKAFDVAAPAEQVPLTDNQFVIDSSVEEFTALIFRQNADEQTQLVGPDATVYEASKSNPDVKWHRSPDYDLITVNQPLEGEWGVKADMAPDSRVTVVSNLNLRVLPLPINVMGGQVETLSLMLQEDGKTIDRPEFLSLMKIEGAMEAGNDEFDLTEFWRSPIGAENPPADGIYSQVLPAFEKSGIYQLSVIVDGKTFIRQFTHQFHVRQPFGAEVKQMTIEGKNEYVLVVNSYSQDIDIPRTQVAATIETPDGRKKIRPLNPTEADTWQAILLPEKEGKYTATVKTKGFNNAGKPFEVTLAPVDFIYAAGAGFSEEKAPFFPPEASPEPSQEPSPAPEEEGEGGDAASGDTGESAESIPPWLLYTILGLGNLVIFALGFFAFRKIMGSNDKIMEEYADEKVAAPEVEAEPEPELEEEPPMEDLEPVLSAPEPEPIPAPMEVEEQDISDDLEMPEEPQADDLDDLDAMSDPDGGAAEEAEDDDMVAEMLKAQGLDLAEDELDEAISTLIDDLDSSGDDDDGGMDSMDDMDDESDDDPDKI